MKSSFDDEADQIIGEMMSIGADFDVSRSGPNGEMRWFYSAHPGARDDLRRFKAGVDLTRPGFEEAMVRAVVRTKFVGAP